MKKGPVAVVSNLKFPEASETVVRMTRFEPTANRSTRHEPSAAPPAAEQVMPRIEKLALAPTLR